MNFLSKHPSHQKTNIVKNLIHRMTSISDERFWNLNFQKIRSILRDNNYPSYFINKIICEWKSDKNLKKDTERRGFSKLPNIPILTNRLKGLFKNEEFGNITTYNLRTTQLLFSTLKQQDERSKTKDIVYQFDCLECNSIYIGETKQYIKKRISQHKNSCKHTFLGNDSALSLHSKNNNHHFNYDDFKILAREKDDRKRKTKEAIYITKERGRAINFKTDTDHIGVIYNNIIDSWER